MTELLISDLDAELRDRLLHRAEQHGRSLEDEIKEILRDALDREVHPEAVGLGTRISQRFADIGLDQDIEEFRGQYPEPARFDE